MSQLRFVKYGSFAPVLKWLCNETKIWYSMFGVDLLYIAYIHLTLISMGMFTCSRDSAVYISVYARRVTKYKTLKPYIRLAHSAGQCLWWRHSLNVIYKAHPLILNIAKGTPDPSVFAIATNQPKQLQLDIFKLIPRFDQKNPICP